MALVIPAIIGAVIDQTNNKPRTQGVLTPTTQSVSDNPAIEAAEEQRLLESARPPYTLVITRSQRDALLLIAQAIPRNFDLNDDGRIDQSEFDQITKNLEAARRLAARNLQQGTITRQQYDIMVNMINYHYRLAQLLNEGYFGDNSDLFKALVVTSALLFAIGVYLAIYKPGLLDQASLMAKDVFWITVYISLTAAGLYISYWIVKTLDKYKWDLGKTIAEVFVSLVKELVEAVVEIIKDLISYAVSEFKKIGSDIVQSIEDIGQQRGLGTVPAVELPANVLGFTLYQFIRWLEEHPNGGTFTIDEASLIRTQYEGPNGRIALAGGDAALQNMNSASTSTPTSQPAPPDPTLVKDQPIYQNTLPNTESIDTGRDWTRYVNQ